MLDHLSRTVHGCFLDLRKCQDHLEQIAKMFVGTLKRKETQCIGKKNLRNLRRVCDEQSLRPGSHNLCHPFALLTAMLFTLHFGETNSQYTVHHQLVKSGRKRKL